MGEREAVIEAIAKADGWIPPPYFDLDMQQAMDVIRFRAIVSADAALSALDAVRAALAKEQGE